MRLKNDGAESKGIFVTRRSRAATIEVGRASFPQHIANSVCNNPQGGTELGRGSQVGA